MKRSEMVEHIKADLEEMVEVIKLRPDAAKYQPERFANNILDMIEGFDMLPPARYRNHDWNNKGITYSEWLQLTSKVNEWDKE